MVLRVDIFVIIVGILADYLCFVMNVKLGFVLIVMNSMIMR